MTGPSLLLIWICIYTFCQVVDVTDLELIDAESISNAKIQCNKQNGSLTLPQHHDVGYLRELLNQSQSVKYTLWNGYYVKTPWLENLGCFNRIKESPARMVNFTGMTIAKCWNYCKQFGDTKLYALRIDSCSCETNGFLDKLYLKANSSECGALCKGIPWEFCGSIDRTRHSVYLESNISKHFNNVSCPHNCLYKDGNTNDVKIVNCSIQATVNNLACINRSQADNSTRETSWLESKKACTENNSTMVALRQAKERVLVSDSLWLNERRYEANFINIPDRKPFPSSSQDCQIVRMSSEKYSGVKVMTQKCSAVNVTYLCEKGESQHGVVNHLTSFRDAANSYSISGKENDSCQVTVTTDFTSPATTVTSIFIGRNDNDPKGIAGQVTGAVIGSVVVLLASLSSVGVIIIFQKRSRHKREGCQTSNLNVDTAKTRTSSAMSSSDNKAEVNYDIIHGNPERNSKEDAYMTIADEDLIKSIETNNITKDGRPTARNTENQNYFILESLNQKTSKPSASSPCDLASPIQDHSTVSCADVQTPYDLSGPLKNVLTSDTTAVNSNLNKTAQSKSKNSEYDHLRQAVLTYSTNIENHDPDNDYAHADDANNYYGTRENTDILNEDDDHYSRSYVVEDKDT